LDSEVDVLTSRDIHRLSAVLHDVMEKTRTGRRDSSKY
jgi:hypothetical protein